MEGKQALTNERGGDRLFYLATRAIEKTRAHIHDTRLAVIDALKAMFELDEPDR